MPREYHHLTEAERETIQLLLDMGKSPADIGSAIGRHKTTIYREINRNASPEYKRYLTHRAELGAVEQRKQASQRRAHRQQNIGLSVVNNVKPRSPAKQRSINGQSTKKIGRNLAIGRAIAWCPEKARLSSTA